MGRVGFGGCDDPAHGLGAVPPDNGQAALGESSGLVEDHPRRPGETLEGVASLDEDAGAGGVTHRGAHRQGSRETEGARAADDEQGDRILHRLRGVDREPDGEGDEGEAEHGQYEPTRDPIGEQDHRRAALRPFFNEAEDSSEPGVGSGRSDFDLEPAGQARCTGVDGIAGSDRDGSRLAGEQRQIHGRLAGEDDAVGRGRISGPEFHDHTRIERRRRHLSNPAVLDDPSGRRSQREEQFGGAGGTALLPPLHPAPDQKKEDEDRDRVEIDLAVVADGVGHPPAEGGEDADRDRHIHVQGARFQRAPGAAVEDLGAPQDRGQSQTETDPAEERSEGGGDAVEVAAVEREGEQHDIAGDGAGDRDADEQGAVLSPLHVASLDAVERVRRVADGVEEAGDGTQRCLLRIPDDGGQRPADIETALGDTRDHEGDLLHQPDAGRAVNPLEIELDGGHPVSPSTAVELGKRRVVELVVGSAPTLGRKLGCVDPLLEVVVALEPGAVDDVVGHPAARTAELQFGVVINQPRRHRQPTVGARNHRSIFSCAERVRESPEGRDGQPSHFHREERPRPWPRTQSNIALMTHHTITRSSEDCNSAKSADRAVGRS